MAKKQQFKMNIAERSARTFSDSFKASKVREIESGRTKIYEIIREYEVSRTSIYKWIKAYGSLKNDKPERMVFESESDTKKLLEFKKKVAELEQIIGQKQILLDFQNKMIELAEEKYGVDIKKNFFSRPSSSSEKTIKK